MAAFELAKQSWGVLTKHPNLMWFPVITIIGVVVALAFDAVLFITALFGGAVVASKTSVGSDTAGNGLAGVAVLIMVLAVYLAAVVHSVCRAALVVETNKILANPYAHVSVGSGFGGAFARFPALLGWSVIQAVVGSVVAFVRDESSFLGRLVGMAWNVVSFLGLPFLVLEGLGPVESLKRSTAVLKERWGDNLKLNLGMQGVFIAGVIVIMAPAGGLMWLGDKAHAPVVAAVAAVVALVCFAAFSLVISTLTSILRTAFYRSIKDNRAPVDFAGERFQQMVYTR